MAVTETAGIPRAHLRTVILLLLQDEPSHGYDLLEAARGLGMHTAEPAGMYRTLRALERDELVRSRWEPSQSGPARRTYELTPAGTHALAAGMTELVSIMRSLESLLERYSDQNRNP